MRETDGVHHVRADNFLCALISSLFIYNVDLNYENDVVRRRHCHQNARVELLLLISSKEIFIADFLVWLRT